MTAEENVAGRTREARLRRLERVFVPWPIYFLTANTASRLSILAVPEIHSTFQDFAKLGENRGAFIGAYVLMPDHIHLFVALDPETTLAAWVKSLKNSLVEDVAAFGYSRAALAERLFRSCVAKRGFLRSEMGIRP